MGDKGFYLDASTGYVNVKRLINDQGDRLYLCQLCFAYFAYDALADSEDPNFVKEDICKACHLDEQDSP